MLRVKKEKVGGGYWSCDPQKQFRGKRTSQTANGSNSDWRSRIRDGPPVNDLRPRTARKSWGAPNSGKEDGVTTVLSDVRSAQGLVHLF